MKHLDLCKHVRKLLNAQRGLLSAQAVVAVDSALAETQKAIDEPADGVRLDASTPHFGNVYSFAPTFQENHYFGHVNGTVAQKLIQAGILDPRTDLAPYFPNEQTVFSSSRERFHGDGRQHAAQL